MTRLCVVPMEIIEGLRMQQHGCCLPRSERACTLCNARDDWREFLAAYAALKKEIEHG